ncbi:retrovirus-related pol polyprotein from transposon TNT 1-94, partial [Tanacetum coccineum]
MLIYAKALLFLWEEAVATTCYTQNHSLIRLCHEKTPYELLHDRKLDLSYPHVFGALRYPTNDSEDLGKLKAKADDTLLQPLFDEYFSPHPCVDHPVLEVVTSEPVVSTGTPSSTSVDQDAPSPSTLQTPQESPSHVIPPRAEEADHDIKVAHMDNNPHFDRENPNHVYKLKKALYGLKQAPRAWYDLLSLFLLSQKFSKRTVDPTLFIRREGKDILLVQIHVDDIIYASTKPDLYADHAGFQDTRRSTSGSMQLLGYRLVSWSSKKQKSIAISSTEAEYIALSGCLENGVVELYFVRIEYQLADIFTKALGRERLDFLINKLGMRNLVDFGVTIHIITILKSEMRISGTLLTLMIRFQLLERDKLDLNLLKKGLLVRGEAMKASKRRRSMLDYRIQQLSKGSSEGSVQDVSNDEENKAEENKADAEVAEKQARNVQTSLTLSSAELEIQSMVDVPNHQEDPTVQRTLLIDTVILMVTKKTTSIHTPPTTQAQVQMCSTSCWKGSSREAWNALLVQGKQRRT